MALLSRFTRPLFLACCLAVLALPALAQDGLMYSVSVYQCDRNELPDLVDMMHERQRPIAQSLVDDGLYLTWGRAVHQWGDEWNLMTWQAAPTMQGLMDARDEAMSRYQEAYPPSDDEPNPFMNTCPVHRDYFYTREAGTTFGLDPSTPEDSKTLAVSFYTCDYAHIDEIVAWEKETMQPAAQALVDEGVYGSRSLFTHAWGDEWNVLVSQSGEDFPQILSALTTLSERTGTRPMEDGPTPLNQYCSAHKDNVYWMVSTVSAQD